MLDKKNLKRKFARTESYIFLALVLFSFLVQARSGQFYTGNNLVDQVRSLTIPAMFCIGELFILLSGGIDVSFPSIAALSMFVVSKVMINYTGSIFTCFLMGLGLGLVMGAINGFLVGRFNFIPLIVTLGTSSIYTGIMNGILWAHESPIPEPMLTFGKKSLFQAYNPMLDIKSKMPMTILFLVGIVILAYFILHYTKLGRGVYAIGGDITAARRAGYNVFWIQMFIYSFSGALAGFIGVARASMMLNCSPQNMIGMEMTIIAACVLGGIRVTGGFGTITGAMLGITLITVLSNSLILLGIPTYWQRVFTGCIIIIGTATSAYQMLNKQKKLANKQEGRA